MYCTVPEEIIVFIKAPVSLSDKKTRGQAHWIRRYNSTVLANDQEEQKLHELAAKIPFDERITLDNV